MRLVKLLRPHGQLFTGEVGGWPDDQAAELVAEKIGIYADVTIEDDKPHEPTDSWVFDPKTDPFVVDGVSKLASQALHTFRLHTTDDVRKFIIDTPEGESPLARLCSIDGIKEPQAERIFKLYGPQSE